jgi:hypothetical protein
VSIIRISFILVLFLAARALAGVVLEIETKDHRSNESGTVVTLVDGKDLKMTITSGGDQEESEMIFRGEKREMIVVDHDDKTFMVIDEAMIDSIGDQLSGYEAQMREALKDVPPEQRAMVEKMMKGRMPAPAKAPARPKIEFRNTGDHDTKNGYPSVKYEATINDRKTQEFWVTDWDNVDGGDDVVEAFQAMAEFFKHMRDSMPRFGADDDADDNPFEHMQEMDGFPVLTYDYASDGSIASESSLRSSTQRAVAAAEFEPPAAYKQREMMPR